MSASMLWALLAGPPSPVAAQDPPADTVGIIKADETPSNAEVAVRLSEATELPDTTTVVIGRDDEFADSLASGVLQSTSPLLLVPSAGPVPDRVRAELARLAPDRVILLGGEVALEPQVADELAGLGYAVERRAGASRFETATAIARTDAAAADTVILARAFPSEGATDPTQGFADALAGGGMAAEFGWPVLLTQTDVLTPTTRAYLQEAGIEQVEIMGGTAAISAGVEAEINGLGIATERVAGASRAETAIAVAEKRGAPSAAEVAHVVLVQGQEADAWAGGFAAAARSALLDAPIVLAAESQLPPETRAWLEGPDGAGGFAQAGGPVLTCVTVPSLCEQARVALGLPPAGGVTFSPAPGSTVDSSQAITATFAGPVEGLVQYRGTCLSTTGNTPVQGTTMLLGVDVGVPAGPCTFSLTFPLGAPEVQTVEVSYIHSGAPSTELLSRTSSGPAGGGNSPSASADGSVVAFRSDGPLVPGVTEGEPHVYLHRGGGVELVDVTTAGDPAVAGPIIRIPDASVSSEGGHVAFTSQDQTLDPQRSSNAQISGYLRDLAAGSTRLVVVDAAGAALQVAELPSIDADGTVVAYNGRGEFDASTGSVCSCIWWHDLVTGEVGVIRDSRGQPVGSDAAPVRPQLSADGRFIAFQTDQALDPELDDNNGADTYLYEIATGTLELISVAPDGTAGTVTTLNPQIETGISGDGRYLVFAHAGGDLIAGETVDPGHIYLRDREAGTTIRISQGGGGPAGSASGRPQISDDGAWVVFSSDRVLIPSTQGGCGVYRYEVAGGSLDRPDLGASGGGFTGCPNRMDVADDGTVVFDHPRPLHIDDVLTGPDIFRAAAPRTG